MSPIQPGLFGAERAALDAKWAALRRCSPDPEAIDAVPPWRFNIVHYLAHIPYAAAAVLYIPYLTIKHVLCGQVWHSWTYTRMLRTRLNKLWGNIVGAYPAQEDQDPYAYGRTAIAQGRYDALQATTPRGGSADQDGGEGGYEIESVVLEPVEDELRVGVGVNEHVRAERVVAFWVSPRAAAGRAEDKAREGEKVILHIHGGGYLFGHPLANHLGVEVAMASGVRLLGMSYRKPLLPHTAFPAPLLDVLAGYLHLLHLGFASENITLLGKSAGGHLALMLLRYIAELRLPMPGAVGMMAPWCDLTMSFPSYRRHSDFDTLCPRRLAVPVRSAMRWYTSQAMDEAYFTPAKAGKAAWTWLGDNGVRVYVMFGTRELFEDEIRKMIRDMQAAGAEVRVREDPDGLHTSPLIYPESMAIFVKDMCELIGGTSGG